MIDHAEPAIGWEDGYGFHLSMMGRSGWM
jgi:hypothetical protein